MPNGRTIIPCELLPETQARIDAYAKALEEAAPGIGAHGLGPEIFWDSGIFRSAVEKLRGIQAASMEAKRSFMADVLNFLREAGLIGAWEFTGGGERHDYEIRMPSGRISVVETKGCLDGNNTTIFERPPQADEFILWSLCQNPGSDPRHNAWSGIHTRLGAEMIYRKAQVDGVVIWDMLCGTLGRPCPKLASDPARATEVAHARSLPPPCVYLFPRSIPDPRNNPAPPCWQLEEVQLLDSLCRGFNGDRTDVVEVRIEARMEGVELQRRTRFLRGGEEVTVSRWASVKRAR